jgi:L-ribulose-5-phosphate 4-epimerase
MKLYKYLREKCYECNMELPRRNLVLYTFGNVSVIDRDKGVFAIKPSGIPYEELNPENIVVVDLDNKVVEGNLNPSSDTKTHSKLYKYFPEILGITHTHSTYATAWAQSCKPIPIFGTTHADHIAQDVPCTRIMTDEMIKGNYEEETGNQIIETFKNISYKEVEMVLVACHGPFTWGNTPEKSVYNSAILEELAKMALLTLQIDPKTPGLKQPLIEKHFFRKHGNNAYYGQK